jgi:hypothetical protein
MTDPHEQLPAHVCVCVCVLCVVCCVCVCRCQRILVRKVLHIRTYVKASMMTAAEGWSMLLDRGPVSPPFLITASLGRPVSLHPPPRT